MEEIIMSIDAGKHTLKSVGKNIKEDSEKIKKIDFRSKMYDMSNGYSDVEGNSFKVKFEKQTYIVGEQGEEGSDETSKTTLLHQLCAYTSIAQYIKPKTKDNNIYAVLACPLSILKNKEAKEEYKSFIKGNGEINITINDHPYSFTIKELMIKAEGSGVVYLEPGLFENKKVAVIDFGGLNMNFCIYENKIALPSSRFTIEHGSNLLNTYIATALTEFLKGQIVSDYEAAQALKDGYLTQNDKPNFETVPVIENCITRFLTEALKSIKKHGNNLDMMKVVFVGGTSQSIENQIKNMVEHAYVPQNSQWATAEGLYKVAFAKYGQK